MLRTYILTMENFNVQIVLLGEFVYEIKAKTDFVLGLLMVIPRLLILGFWEEFINTYTISMGSGNSTSQSSLLPDKFFSSMEDDNAGEGPSSMREELEEKANRIPQEVESLQGLNISDEEPVSSKGKGKEIATPKEEKGKQIATSSPKIGISDQQSPEETAIPAAEIPTTTRSAPMIGPMPQLEVPRSGTFLGVDFTGPNMNDEKRAKIFKLHLELEQYGMNLTIIDAIRDDTREHNKAIRSLAKEFDLRNTLPIENLPRERENDVAVITLLQQQSRNYGYYRMNRRYWLQSRAINLLPENRIEVERILARMEESRLEYVRKIADFEGSDTKLAKQFYNYLNEYRNATQLDLNKADAIVTKDINSTPQIGKNTELRKAINREKDEAIREFRAADEGVKKKLAKLFYSPKK
jgi:hypothetical protein